MNRDPTVVGRARVSAETFAEIINSFIEPISYKTMVRHSPLVSLILGILSTGSLRISIPVQFCIRFVTTTGSCSSICAISTSTTASDTRAHAKSGHDESLDRQDWKDGKSATENKPETR